MRTRLRIASASFSSPQNSFIRLAKGSRLKDGAAQQGRPFLCQGNHGRVQPIQMKLQPKARTPAVQNQEHTGQAVIPCRSQTTPVANPAAGVVNDALKITPAG
jgi:hypothetical protein